MDILDIHAQKLILDNAPNLVVLGIMVKAYLKLRGFVDRFEQLEKKTERIFKYCLNKNKALDLVLDEPVTKEKQ